MKAIQLEWKRLRSRYGKRALILGYHRIHHQEHDPLGLCVSPEHFARQMEFIAQAVEILSLRELSEAVQADRVRGRTVAVTFDDGYLETLTVAAPILKELKIPATVFLVTGNPGHPFWWDQLVECVLSCDFTAERRMLTVDEASLRWFLPEADKMDAITILNWKFGVVKQLQALLQPLEPAKRRNAIRQIAAWTHSEVESVSVGRGLSKSEIQELMQDELIQPGAHSVDHQPLASLPLSEQRREVEESRDFLQELIGTPVFGFSYPHGSFSDETCRVVREAGYAVACSSVPDSVSAKSDPMRLPRLWVPDWDGNRFETWLRRWIGG